ncbi:hypothetical protein V6B16_10340 [Salinimicrobium catena]|uniref:hypothetical protein n=1 Tax=Salinimicrobium catena TaxID=390640 RepID=UPI002FE4F5C2
METFRSRLKNGDIKKANWQELYILTRHWKSDLEFYIEDLQFLQRLIGKYSIWIEKAQNSVAVSKLLSDLHQLSDDGRKILDKLQDHLEQLSGLMNNDKGIDPENFIKTHEIIEDEISQFVKSFRNNRKEVYRLTEEIMDSEDLTPE